MMMHQQAHPGEQKHLTSKLSLAISDLEKQEKELSQANYLQAVLRVLLAE